MEEKVYKKQVSKQALSARVIDAQTPDNQFTISEKSELLTFNDQDEVEFEVEEGDDGDESGDDDNSEYNNTHNTNTTKSSNSNKQQQQQPTVTTTNSNTTSNSKLKTIKRAMKLLSSGVRDEVLLELVRNYQSIIHSIEDQGSLLKDNEEARLSEEEQMQADAELELELRNEEAGRNPVASVPSVLLPGLTGMNNSVATGNSNNMSIPAGGVAPVQPSSTGVTGSLPTGQNYDPSVFGGNPVLAPGFFQRLNTTTTGGGTATPAGVPSPRPATVSAIGPPGSITRPSAAMVQPTTSGTTNAQFRPTSTASSIPPTATASAARSAPTVTSAQPNTNNTTNTRPPLPPASAVPISVKPPTTTNRTATTATNPANPTPTTANPNPVVPANPGPGPSALPAIIDPVQLKSILDRRPDKIPTVRRILDSQTMSVADKRNAMSALLEEVNRA